jgi:hypothetical protein
MTTLNKQFDLFGVTYRTTQFAAVTALDIMARAGSVHPTENLRLTEVKTKGGWVRLDTAEAINEWVIDVLFAIPPNLVLNGVLKVVNEFSFGFTAGWTGVKIPSRFKSDDPPRESKYVDPLIAQLLQEEAATLRELEEYYSLEDAFKMFDVMVAKGVNAALAQESAMKKK